MASNPARDLFHGYFQNEHYLLGETQAVADAFRLEPDPALTALGEEIRAKGAIGMHVRRSEYGHHGLAAADYYRNAIADIRREQGPAPVVCFSDEPNFCRAPVLRDIADFYGDAGYREDSPLSDFRLLSGCRHFVIANSLLFLLVGGLAGLGPGLDCSCAAALVRLRSGPGAGSGALARDRECGAQPLMADRPKLSICMPTYNRAAYLEAAFAAIFNQGEVGCSFELVVSDNHSTDNTPEVIAAWSSRHPEIRSVRQPRNTGYIDNYMSVHRLAVGEYAIYLADDDRLVFDVLRVVLKFMDEHPGVACAQTPWEIWSVLDVGPVTSFCFRNSGSSVARTPSIC